MKQEKSASIIRGTCAFDTKIWGFSRESLFVSAYEERDKKIFRKIEICQNLLSFLFENRCDFRHVLCIENCVLRIYYYWDIRSALCSRSASLLKRTLLPCFSSPTIALKCNPQQGSKWVHVEGKLWSWRNTFFMLEIGDLLVVLKPFW